MSYGSKCAKIWGFFSCMLYFPGFLVGFFYGPRQSYVTDVISVFGSLLLCLVFVAMGATGINFEYSTPIATLIAAIGVSFWNGAALARTIAFDLLCYPTKVIMARSMADFLIVATFFLVVRTDWPAQQVAGTMYSTMVSGESLTTLLCPTLHNTSACNDGSACASRQVSIEVNVHYFLSAAAWQSVVWGVAIPFRTIIVPLCQRRWMKSPSDLVDILFADQLLTAANG